MVTVTGTEIRFGWSAAADAYVIYAGQTEIGRAPDLDGVIAIIRFWESKNEYTSKNGDNESSGRATNFVAQKSQ